MIIELEICKRCKIEYEDDENYYDGYCEDCYYEDRNNREKNDLENDSDFYF